ncbi:hypothetical protein H696_01827 [Fonticula alba]|uniref:Uncharacterized protein n=1 Tax=Fonticula alba TaxID=691883 RepID=A0A058Z988_FONAL|nr:hypothetical protein H696_01827 [Fonticula alba]KCV70879.1 hypothetical protein H696_01827 [Fonticula alba]|eukprot:XP_009494002.1 hypothetical protein H696_01827 [Fonticula alba]
MTRVPSILFRHAKAKAEAAGVAFGRVAASFRPSALPASPVAGGHAAASAAPKKPFTYTEVPARFRRRGPSAAEIEAVELGGAGFFI